MIKDQKFTKWINKFNVEEILNLIEKGNNIKQISNIIGIPDKRLCDMFKEYNMPKKSMRQKIAKNQDFFEIIDSEIKAYLLGYIVADGCISIEPKKRNGIIYSYSKRLGFNSSIDDKEVIELLKNNISPNITIKEFNRSTKTTIRKNQLNLRFSSSKIVDDLIKLNVIPNKTYHSDFIFPFEILTNENKIHFIRGFFDGDGSVAKSDISFVSTSVLFLNQIKEILLFNIPNITYRIYEIEGITIKYYRLNINIGKNIRYAIYNLFYNNANYFLTRKKLKFNIENTVLN